MNKVENDLEKLVQMAENVSETVNDLNTKMTNLRGIIAFSIIGMYTSIGAITYLILKPVWLENVSGTIFMLFILLAGSLFFISTYFIFQYFSKSKICRHTLYSERKILNELLDMVYEYKEHIHKEDMSFVENAILEMRLKRIRFSTKW